MNVEIVFVMIAIWTISSAVDDDEDIVCNAGGRFECVCHSHADDDGRTRSSASTNSKLCHEFVTSSSSSSSTTSQSTSLPVARLIVAEFGGDLDVLSARNKVSMLSDDGDGRSVTYEYYFRYYVAKMLSEHCARDANRCPDVGFVVRPENVVILRIANDHDRQRSQGGLVVDYSVVRSFDARQLDPDSVVRPRLIVDAVQPRIHTFIPYPIASHGEHSIDIPQPSAWHENMGLITALLIFAALLVLVYVIAIIKAVRDRAAKRLRESKKDTRPNGPPALATTSKPSQYGSTDRRPTRANDDVEIADESHTRGQPQHRRSIPVTIKVTEVVDSTTDGDDDDTEKLISNGPNQEKSIQRLPMVLSSSTMTKRIAGSRSMQFDRPSKTKAIEMVKKSITCYFPSDIDGGDRSDRRWTEADRYAVETYDDAKPSGDAIATAQYDSRNDQFGASTTTAAAAIEHRDSSGSLIDNRESSTSSSIADHNDPPASVVQYPSSSVDSNDPNVVQIPVLIVPAMSKHRNDRDFVAAAKSKSKSANVATDDRSFLRSKQYANNNRDTNAKDLTQTISEEQLISSSGGGGDLNGRRESSIDQISSSDAETINSNEEEDDEDEEDDRGEPSSPTIGFDVGYQPLHDSDWSVNRLGTSTTSGAKNNQNGDQSTMNLMDE